MVLAAYFLVTGSFRFFTTAILGLPANLAGLIMALPILRNAAADLPMGWISGHLRSRHYRRSHVYLSLAAMAGRCAAYSCCRCCAGHVNAGQRNPLLAGDGPAILLLVVPPTMLFALSGYRLDRGSYGTAMRKD